MARLAVAERTATMAPFFVSRQGRILLSRRGRMRVGRAPCAAIGVLFNVTVAAFTVVPDTEITTDVPARAASGKVQVITANGVMLSNVAFRVQ